MFTLKVSNFQSIQNIELEVDGLTVVTAPTHSGKTSLIRAADALLTANWYQESYMRKGCNLCSITLQDPSNVISYTRKGSSSSYTVNGETFSKLSGNAPQVLGQLGFGSVSISRSAKDTISITPQIQNQFDGPYQDIIDPVAMTQLLGSFTNLAPYQTAHDRVKKLQSETRREIDRSQETYKKLTAISSYLESYTPSVIQESLDTLDRVLVNIERTGPCIETLLGSVSLRDSLQGLKRYQIPFNSNSVKCAKIFSLGAKSLEELSSQVVFSTNTLKTCNNYRSGFTLNVNTSFVKAFTQASQYFGSQINSWEKLPRTLQALTCAKRSLKASIGVAPLKSFISSLHEVSKQISAISEYQGSLLSLQKSREEMHSSFLDVESQHTLFKDSVSSGKCPLCSNVLK